MFFFRCTDPNDPRRGMNRDDGPRTLSEPARGAAQDGYVRLSRADRMTGYRPPVGPEPETHGCETTD